MHSVDVFVLYDDVQYMKSGWINRNRILADKEPAWFTFPVHGASYTAPINERHYKVDRNTIANMKRRLEDSYSRAPMFTRVFPFLCDLIDYSESNVAEYNKNLLTLVAKRLGIRCNILCSSEIDGFSTLRSEDRVTELCSKIGASTYINPIGGISLYHASNFFKRGIDLRFLRSLPTSYTQYSVPHVPYLSIIDVLMFNSSIQIDDMLNHYDSVKPEAVQPFGVCSQ